MLIEWYYLFTADDVEAQRRINLAVAVMNLCQLVI